MNDIPLGISSQKPIMGRLMCGEMGTVELKKGGADPTTEDLKRVAEGAGKVKGKESIGVGERMDAALGVSEKMPKKDVGMYKNIERTALKSKLGREPTKQEVSGRMGREQYSDPRKDIGSDIVHDYEAGAPQFDKRISEEHRNIKDSLKPQNNEINIKSVKEYGKLSDDELANILYGLGKEDDIELKNEITARIYASKDISDANKKYLLETSSKQLLDRINQLTKERKSFWKKY